jgi:hypothetical protein
LSREEFIQRLQAESNGPDNDPVWFEDNGFVYFIKKPPRWIYELDVNAHGERLCDRFVNNGPGMATLRDPQTVTVFGPLTG